MQAYLFVHFREKRTPDGEQVYFSLSRDGFQWEAVNGGNPVLWSYLGEKGVRDCTIVRCPEEGKFRIIATDLSLAYSFKRRYNCHWPTVSRFGSKCLALWESEDLVNWSEQRLLELGNEEFGCLWAPDVLYDRERGEYLLHWSSRHGSNGFGNMGIYFARTKDFVTFSKPELLYQKEDSSVIDSAIYEEDGKYYMFLKSDGKPENIILVRGDRPEGPYTRVGAFDESMQAVEPGLYEGATAVRLEDGRWCLFLDYYGASPEGQGYVPFVANSLASGGFVRSDEQFSFPYGFKHGTVLTITMEEYKRIKAHNWEQDHWT